MQAPDFRAPSPWHVSLGRSLVWPDGRPAGIVLRAWTPADLVREPDRTCARVAGAELQLTDPPPRVCFAESALTAARPDAVP